MPAATWLALALFAPDGVVWPEARVVILLMAHLTAVGWCFGGVALAAGAWARRRGSALAPVAIVAVALYLVDVLAESWAAMAQAGRVSPFHYYHGAAILAGTANTTVDLSILGATSVVAVGLAYWRFGVRDL
jgi:hypothetical protein